jgi:hypothetical protein
MRQLYKRAEIRRVATKAGQSSACTRSHGKQQRDEWSSRRDSKPVPCDAARELKRSRARTQLARTERLTRQAKLKQLEPQVVVSLSWGGGTSAAPGHALTASTAA